MDSGPVISTKVKLLVDTTTVTLRTTSTTANARGVPPESEKSTMVPSTSEASDREPMAPSGSGRNTADNGNRTRSPERVSTPPVGRERQRFRPGVGCRRRANGLPSLQSGRLWCAAVGETRAILPDVAAAVVCVPGPIANRSRVDNPPYRSAGTAVFCSAAMQELADWRGSRSRE